MLFLFRLCFTLLRSALVALSIIVTGWFLMVAPTTEERRLLSGREGEALRSAVAQMRLARAALALAPDLAVTMIHRQGGGKVSRDEVREGLRTIAAGQSARPEGPIFLKPPAG